MNYYKNETDDLKIKAHLDASLDKKGISVSEELISRTLAAIKADSQKADGARDRDADNRRLIPWNKYIFAFARVAAVVMIVAAGYAIIRNIPAKKFDSMEMKSSGNSQAPDTASIEYSGMEKALDNAKVDMFSDNDEIYSFAGAPDADTLDGGADADDKAMLRSFTVAMEMAPKAAADIHDVILAEPERIQSLTLTEGDAGSIQLTEAEAINEFCAIMAKHQFSSSQPGEEGNEKYVITVSKQDEGEYIIAIGGRITLEYAKGESSIQEIYEVEDMDLLLNELKELYDKYK